MGAYFELFVRQEHCLVPHCVRLALLSGLRFRVQGFEVWIQIFPFTFCILRFTLYISRLGFGIGGAGLGGWGSGEHCHVFHRVRLALLSCFGFLVFWFQR